MIAVVRPKTCKMKQPGDLGGRSYKLHVCTCSMCSDFLCLLYICNVRHQTVFRTNEAQKLSCGRLVL